MNIIHHPEIGQFQTTIDGHTAHVAYVEDEHSLDIRHTIVPKELEGRGIASALVKAAYDYAIEHKLTPVATCSYAVVWLQRHPEYNGKTSCDYYGEGSCAL